MSRDYKVYLEDILESIGKIRRYVEGMSYDDFSEDSKTIDAVVRNLEIVGEAVKHLPTEIREAAKEIPWRRIAGVRDILIHAYFDIDLEIVWEIVTEKLGPLERTIRDLRQIERGAES